MSPVEILTLAFGGLNAVGLLYLAFRKSSYERQQLDADAEVDYADAEDKRTETDRKRFALYEEMFTKLMERDQTIADLKRDMQILKADFAEKLDIERFLRLAAEAKVIKLETRMAELEHTSSLKSSSEIIK